MEVLAVLLLIAIGAALTRQNVREYGPGCALAGLLLVAVIVVVVIGVATGGTFLPVGGG